MSAQKPLVSRLRVAAWGIPLIVIAVLFGSWLFALLMATVAGIALYEFYALAESRHLNPQTVPGVLLAVIAVFLSNFLMAGIWIALMLILTILLAFIEIRFGERQGLRDLPVTLFGWLYIPFFLGLLVLIRNAVWDDLEPSSGYVLYFLSSIWICDTAAYVGGKILGIHSLAPFVSPKKTWEGFFFGIIGAIFWALIWMPILAAETNSRDLLYVALIVGTIGQFGDLIESYFKRSADVKDSGNLLSEHGGIFDRFDSIILSTPFIFIYQVAMHRIPLF